MSLCEPDIQILTRPASNINFKIDPKVTVNIDEDFDKSQKKQQLNTLMIMEGGSNINLSEMHPTIEGLPRYIDITGRSKEEIDAFKTNLLTQIDAQCEIQTKNESPKILTGGKYKKKSRRKKRTTNQKRKSHRKYKKRRHNRTKSRK